MSDEEDFLAWGRAEHLPVSLWDDDLSDLEILGRRLGDAPIVALGEGLHGAAEPLAFRNRLFRYLSQARGFRALAIESGLTASFAAEDYVQGAEGDPGQVAKRSITSGLGGFEEQGQILSWMRAFNLSREKGARLSFYGMDLDSDLRMGGSALDLALACLSRLKPSRAADIGGRIEPLRAFLGIDRRADSPDQHCRLSADQRDQVTAALSDLYCTIRTFEAEVWLNGASEDIDRASRAAWGACRTDQYLRRFPSGWTPQAPPALEAIGVADLTKADNVEWILGRSGPGTGVLVFCHLGHAASTPVTVDLGVHGLTRMPAMMGAFLKARRGVDYVVIGHYFAIDATGLFGDRREAPKGSLEHLLSRIAPTPFLLDLRRAPAAVRAYLDPVRPLFGQAPTHALSPGRGVDIILFTPLATRSNQT